MVDLTEGPANDDMHAVAVVRTSAGWLATCRCGQWEGWFSGPRSRLFVEDDHDHHRRAASNGASLPPVE